MRLTFAPTLITALLLCGCANQGVVVDKFARPSPFAYSLGIDGMYTLKLKDQQGVIHSQMVTPEIYSAYQIGDYFNDQQPPPARRDIYESGRWDGKDSRSMTYDGGKISAPTHKAHKKKHQAAKSRQARKKHSLAAKKRDLEKKRPKLSLRASLPEPQGLNVTR